MTDWRDRARCAGADGEPFFRHQVGPKVKQLCAGCPVRVDCREWALTFPPALLPGYWGGTTQEERRRIHRLRQRHSGAK